MTYYVKLYMLKINYMSYVKCRTHISKLISVKKIIIKTAFRCVLDRINLVIIKTNFLTAQTDLISNQMFGCAYIYNFCVSSKQ